MLNSQRVKDFARQNPAIRECTHWNTSISDPLVKDLSRQNPGIRECTHQNSSTSNRSNTIARRMIQDWISLFFLLTVLLLIKNFVVRVDFNTEDVFFEPNTYYAANSPYHIHINLDEQIMYVFRNNELEKTYPVSGGKNATPSPLGEWVIIQKAKWGDGFGGSWMGLNVPWGKYGIHGTRTPWVIGKENVSGGCIRMKNEDAKELYGFIPYGTKVTIVFENQPFRTLKDGDFGSDVYQVQKALKQLGYFHDWCNGKYGTNTKKAVITYQQEMGFSVSGKVNISTWNKLIQQYEESLLE